MRAFKSALGAAPLNIALRCAVAVANVFGVLQQLVPRDHGVKRRARDEKIVLAVHLAGTRSARRGRNGGYGRSGRFFAHQWAGIKPDIVTMAKGMANGFPIGGVLISPEFEATKGMLGTTFGGNYLAMAAANAVADIFKEENLVANAFEVGEYLKNSIPASPRIREVRGRGLMVGIEFNEPIAEIRGRLLYEKHIFTGVSGKNMIRLLAPLTLTKADVDIFIDALKEVL